MRIQEFEEEKEIAQRTIHSLKAKMNILEKQCQKMDTQLSQAIIPNPKIVVQPASKKYKFSIRKLSSFGLRINPGEEDYEWPTQDMFEQLRAGGVPKLQSIEFGNWIANRRTQKAIT